MVGIDILVVAVEEFNDGVGDFGVGEEDEDEAGFNWEVDLDLDVGRLWEEEEVMLSLFMGE